MGGVGEIMLISEMLVERVSEWLGIQVGRAVGDNEDHGRCPPAQRGEWTISLWTETATGLRLSQ